MRLGLVIQNQAPGAIEYVRDFAPLAENLGYDSIWITDHVVGVKAFEDVGYGPHWLEGLTSLAYMAAQTKKMRVGTSILVMPIRDPVYTAKVLSTIDNLSGGRLTIGIGPGWSKGEFYALGRGQFHEKRGAVTDASLELILRCWQGGEFGWENEFFNFRLVQFDPVPVQKPHPPFWIGGPPVKIVMERIKRFGDAWHPMGADPAEIKAGLDKISTYAGRKVPLACRLNPNTFNDGALLERMAALRDIGCIELLLDIRSSDPGFVREHMARCIAVHRRLK